MTQRYRCLALLVGLICLLVQTGCQGFSGDPGAPGAVILDIGHGIGADGAVSPGVVNGKRLTEATFWYQYAPYVKRVIERAGYRCTICNRGYMPRQEPYRSYARRGRVLHHKRPDIGKRRASLYFPDRAASGIICADYAVWRRASCMVFLHHNSNSRRWVSGGSPSLILYNRYNGRPLAQCIARRMEREILNRGMKNGGLGCKIEPRYKDASRGGGWLNVCDDAGIPAAILEVAYLNNRNHVEYLSKDANARRYAEAVGQGIVDYLRQSGRYRKHVRRDKNRADAGSYGMAPESRRGRVRGARRLVR